MIQPERPDRQPRHSKGGTKMVPNGPQRLGLFGRLYCLLRNTKYGRLLLELTLGCLVWAGLQHPGPLRGPPTAGPTLAMTNLPSEPRVSPPASALPFTPPSRGGEDQSISIQWTSTSTQHYNRDLHNQSPDHPPSRPLLKPSRPASLTSSPLLLPRQNTQCQPRTSTP